MEIETFSIHGAPQKPSRPIAPPIVLSSTFERDETGALTSDYLYGRTANPNRTSIEELLTQLEKGVAALAFSSGTAAMMALFQALQPGDHVLAPDDVYHGTSALLREIFGRWGLQASFVDFTQPETVRKALRAETKLVWMETPSNPLLKITDIAAISALAHQFGAVAAVDNTFASPVLQNPLELGADVVMNSATKYLGGHSDLIAGALVFREKGDLFHKAQQIQVLGGGVPSPFDCWLLQRGLQTLSLRVHAQAANALQIAEFLQTRREVEIVHYPGLWSHPGHAIASRQMRGFGSMLSFQIEAGETATAQYIACMKLCRRATSLGGTETLIEHRALVEGPQSSTPRNLLRVSVGIENISDLIADFSQAFA